MQQAERTGTVVGTGLNDRIFEVIDRLEYHRVVTTNQFREIGDLRQREFDSRDIYVRKFGQCALEEIDYREDTDVFAGYIDGKLVSTIRVNLLKPGGPPTPALSMFGDTLRPLLEQGLTFVDPSRLAVCSEASRKYPGLPLLTQRVGVIATPFYDAYTCLQLVKYEHAAFYRRVYRSTQIAGPNTYPEVNIRVVLMSAPLPTYPDLCRRYPLFSSTPEERAALFSRQTKKRPDIILPSVRSAWHSAA